MITSNPHKTQFIIKWVSLLLRTEKKQTNKLKISQCFLVLYFKRLPVSGNFILCRVDRSLRFVYGGGVCVCLVCVFASARIFVGGASLKCRILRYSLCALLDKLNFKVQSLEPLKKYLIDISTVRTYRSSPSYSFYVLQYHPCATIYCVSLEKKTQQRKHYYESRYGKCLPDK